MHRFSLGGSRSTPSGCSPLAGHYFALRHVEILPHRYVTRPPPSQSGGSTPPHSKASRNPPRLQQASNIVFVRSTLECARRRAAALGGRWNRDDSQRLMLAQRVASKGAARRIPLPPKAVARRHRTPKLRE